MCSSRCQGKGNFEAIPQSPAMTRVPADDRSSRRFILRVALHFEMVSLRAAMRLNATLTSEVAEFQRFGLMPVRIAGGSVFAISVE